MGMGQSQTTRIWPAGILVHVSMNQDSILGYICLTHGRMFHASGCDFDPLRASSPARPTHWIQPMPASPAKRGARKAARRFFFLFSPLFFFFSFFCFFFLFFFSGLGPEATCDTRREVEPKVLGQPSFAFRSVYLFRIWLGIACRFLL